MVGGSAGGCGDVSPAASRSRCCCRCSRRFCRSRNSVSYLRRSSSPIATPLNLTGLRTKYPSRMYHVYSRSSPHIGWRFGPRSSICSCSSRMYCCSFFQLSSRRASTCFMKASRSVWAETRCSSAASVSSDAAPTRMRRILKRDTGSQYQTSRRRRKFWAVGEAHIGFARRTA